MFHPPAGPAIYRNSFVGREHEIAEIERRLASDALITLTGSAGCGKTRLGSRILERLSEQPGVDLYAADLAPLADGSLVPQAVASSLGLQEAPGRVLINVIVDFLGPRRAVLLLDNCEHLLTACRDLAERLLQHCPDLRLVATSRERLGLSGEVVVNVPPLALREAERLFADRAALTRPGFEVTGANQTAVSEICRALDGLPLAVELAATRAAVLSAEQIAARLADRFSLLRSHRDGRDVRHGTLEAALDWSYDLLSEPQRALFRRLSMFPGTVSLEAMEGVCCGGVVVLTDIIDLLQGLSERSLILVEERDGQARYRMLQTIREYGRGKLLEAGESRRQQEEHLAFYLAVAEAAEPQLTGSSQQAAVRRLESEHDNLRAALEFCATDGSFADTELRLAAALWRFWVARGYLTEGRRRISGALERAGDDASDPVLAKALHAAAGLAWNQGDAAEGVRLWDASLTRYRALGDDAGAASSLYGLGLAACHLGEYHRAAALYEESLALRRAGGDRWGTAIALNALGTIWEKLGDSPRALTLYEESLQLMREVGDTRGIAYAELNIGGVTLQQGDAESAVSSFNRGLALLWDAGYRPGIPFALEALAEAAGKQGHPARAARLFGASERLREVLGIPVPADTRHTFERTVAASRGPLDETVFAAAWAAGREEELESLISELLAGAPAPASPMLTVRMLGEFEVRKGGVPIPAAAWRRKRDRLLFSYLLISRQPVPRDTLLEALWPDLSPASAGASLNVAWTNLKRALEPDLAEGAGSSYLELIGGRYRLRWEVVATDVQDFEGRLASADRATRVEDRIAHREAARTLYRGDLLPEAAGEPWTVLERERLRIAYLEMLGRLAQDQLEGNRPDDAVDTLRRILQLEAWREEAYQVLMRVLAGLGRRSEAVRLYRQCEDLLHRELGVAPSEETRRLFESIEAGYPVKGSANRSPLG